MKANRKFIEDDEAVSAVIGGILMVAITVAIASTVYVYTSGFAGSPGGQKENAGVAVTTKFSMIKITLTDGGDNMGTTGYTEDQIKILNNGTVLAQTNLTIPFGWTIGKALWIGGNDATLEQNEPDLNDKKADLVALDPGKYTITVVILDTVVYDSPVTII